MEGSDIVEDARHLVVKVGEGVEGATVDVVPNSGSSKLFGIVKMIGHKIATLVVKYNRCHNKLL
jgi:hypothetical protein